MRPSPANRLPQEKQRAQGKPGARCTRSLVCSVLVAHESSPQVHRNTRPSLRNGFTAYVVLSPATNSSCHRHPRIKGCPRPVGLEKTSANLTPATGARTTRFCRPRKHRSSARRSIAHRPCQPALRSPARPTLPRPPHPMPNVRDDHDTPL
jgi:hypothetical protein